MNICEPVIKIVILNKPKWLIGLNQNGDGRRRADCSLPLRGRKVFPVESRHLTLRTSLSGTWKPRIAPGLPGQLIAKSAYGDAGLGCRKKRMPLCNGADTGCNIPQRESEPTSGGSFIVREFDGTIFMKESK